MALKTSRRDVTWCAASQINIDVPFKLNYVAAHRHGDMRAVNTACRVTCTGCCVQEFDTTRLLQIRAGVMCEMLLVGEESRNSITILSLEMELTKWDLHISFQILLCLLYLSIFLLEIKIKMRKIYSEHLIWKFLCNQNRCNKRPMLSLPGHGRMCLQLVTGPFCGDDRQTDSIITE